MTEFSASSELRPLDTERVLRALTEAGVDYVLIGGVACLVHGASRVTIDADVVPALDAKNLARLLGALASLDAALFVDDKRLQFEAGDVWETDSLRRGPDGFRDADAWHFTTSAGPVDLVMVAAGVGGFSDHLANAARLELFGLPVMVAGLDDLIRSKEALGREKDLSVLSELRRLRET